MEGDKQKMVRLHERSGPEWLQRLLGPAAQEVSCEECFAELDRYVEAELAGSHADERVPGMRAHLDGCPACREEHDLMLEFVQAGGADGD
jgi:hypothetical protein